MKQRYNPLSGRPTARRSNRRSPDPSDALARVQSHESHANYPSIYEGFEAKGIPRDQIQPRVNVLTFHAWRALGRIVKKGEHGVKIVTLIPLPDKTTVDPATGAVKVTQRSRPRSITVFHISQTEARKSEPANGGNGETASPAAVTPPASPAPVPVPAAAPISIPENIIPLPPPRKPSWRDRYFKRA